MMASQPYPLTLAWLSDYGHADANVGMMKGVALSMLTPQVRPWVTLLDVTHGIEPGNVAQGARTLVEAWPTLPVSTVLVAVVGPTAQAGAEEQGYLLAYRPSYQHYVVAPNNGLLAPLLASPCFGEWVVRKVSNPHLGWPNKPEGETQTLAGRDVLTPLAVHILNAWADGRLPTLIKSMGEHHAFT